MDWRWEGKGQVVNVVINIVDHLHIVSCGVLVYYHCINRVNVIGGVRRMEDVHVEYTCGEDRSEVSLYTHIHVHIY